MKSEGGYHVSVAVKKTVHESLKPPHSDRDCLQEGEATPDLPGLKEAIDFHNLPYSENLCLYDCFEQREMRGAGCSLYSNGSDGCSMFDIPTPPAPILQEVAQSCTRCLPKCRKVVYEANINPVQYASYEAISNRRIDVLIYFQSHEVSVSVQTAVHTFTSLYSSIGGIFGLFLGASLISYIELFDFLFRMVIGKVKGLRRGMVKDMRRGHMGTLAQPDPGGGTENSSATTEVPGRAYATHKSISVIAD